MPLLVPSCENTISKKVDQHYAADLDTMHRRNVSEQKQESTLLQRNQDEMNKRPTGRRHKLPMKVMLLLENSKYSHILSWNNDGTSFTITNQREFEKQVMPHFFRNGVTKTRIRDFLQKLERWGFQSSCFSDTTITIDQALCFNHMKFIKGQYLLCKEIKQAGDSSSPTTTSAVSHSCSRSSKPNTGLNHIVTTTAVNTRPAGEEEEKKPRRTRSYGSLTLAACSSEESSDQEITTHKNPSKLKKRRHFPPSNHAGLGARSFKPPFNKNRTPHKNELDKAVRAKEDKMNSLANFFRMNPLPQQPLPQGSNPSFLLGGTAPSPITNSTTTGAAATIPHLQQPLPRASNSSSFLLGGDTPSPIPTTVTSTTLPRHLLLNNILVGNFNTKNDDSTNYRLVAPKDLESNHLLALTHPAAQHDQQVNSIHYYNAGSNVHQPKNVNSIIAATTSSSSVLPPFVLPSTTTSTSFRSFSPRNYHGGGIMSSSHPYSISDTATTTTGAFKTSNKEQNTKNNLLRTILDMEEENNKIEMEVIHLKKEMDAIQLLQQKIYRRQQQHEEVRQNMITRRIPHDASTTTNVDNLLVPNPALRAYLSSFSENY